MIADKSVTVIKGIELIKSIACPCGSWFRVRYSVNLGSMRVEAAVRH